MTLNSASVDVVMPVYNGARYLDEAIRSVMEQSHTRLRLFLCDDGSTDDTASIAREWQVKDSRVVYTPLPHAGVSSARNAGIGACTADYVAFLDADDLWHHEKLEQQLKLFTPETGAVHCSYDYIDTCGNFIWQDRVVPPKKRGDLFDDLLFHDYVLSGSASAVVVRRDVLAKAGLFDERLFYGEDWDLWLRISQHTLWDFSSQALVQIRINPESAQRANTSRRALEFFLQRVMVFEKWPEASCNSGEFAARLRREAIMAALPALIAPWHLTEFYRRLKKLRPYGVRLFKNAADFGGSLGYAVLRHFAHKWRERKQV